MSMIGMTPFSPKPQFLDVNGDPMSGGKLWVYVAGSSTPSSSFSEYTLTTANANPVILDSRGECDFFLANGAYKFVLKDSLDVTKWTIDNITVEDFSASSTLLTKYTVAYTDIQTAALTNTSVVLSLPANTVIEYIVIKHTVAFTGGAISALTVDVGDSGTSDALIGAFDIFQTVADGAAEISSTTYLKFGSATDIILEATAVGANLDQLTQGSVDIWIKNKGMG